MRPHRVGKERVVAAFPEAVLSASLLISPSDREIIGGCQLLINNCPFANPRPDEAITLRAKSVKQSLEPAALDDSEVFGLKNSSLLAYPSSDDPFERVQ